VTNGSESVKAAVREKYAQAAARVASGKGLPADCCSSSGCCGSAAGPSSDPITSDLYADADVAGLPAKAIEASLGCGNPTALAQLREGDVVLDLGSGGGIDVLLSARRVGPTGKAFGLDMTDEMLSLANENKRRAGVTNVEFLKGEIENVPLPDASVDVVISNCVVNLSGDKRRVLKEAFRVLRPGGRFAISDVVVRGYVPDAVRKSVELWIGCVAGALEENQFITLLREAGFADPSIEVTRVYDAADAASFLSAAGLDAVAIAPEIEGRFVSAFVRATKPAGVSEHRARGRDCCGPECCAPAA
jgi:ubiquinone/menaquinone biosynthesis C-methylase UbiE